MGGNQETQRGLTVSVQHRVMFRVNIAKLPIILDAINTLILHILSTSNRVEFTIYGFDFFLN